MKNTFTLFLMLIPITVFSQIKNLQEVADSVAKVKYKTFVEVKSLEFVVLNGVGNYMMTSLRDMQNSVVKNNSLPLVKTTSFPSYFNYSFRLGYKMDKSYLGLTGGFMSTGARSSLSDYSGYVFSDVNCEAINLGCYYRNKFKTGLFLNKLIETGYILDLSYIYSSVNMIDKLHLYSSSGSDYEQTEDYTFHSTGLYSEALFYVKYMFSHHFGLELNAGGALNLSTPLYYKENKNQVQIFNKTRFADWNGFRASVGLVTMF